MEMTEQNDITHTVPVLINQDILTSLVCDCKCTIPLFWHEI